ncbi:MAG TPA: right-handed parallel beta-helix repeat-containing protein, partial [Haliangium sp.]|nr:right-handed parallel beta-helix repeat-containing protein [Haliangium sp.]
PISTAICTPPALPVDTRAPDAVVGTGTAASCTEAALDAALAVGGVVTFDCGAAPHTITVTAEKRIDRDMVLDGGGQITLSGGNATRILTLSAPLDSDSPRLTLQRLTLRAGRAEGAGGAVLRLGGSLTVIDCAFLDNAASLQGLEMAGGAIYAVGGGATTIVGSTFAGNRASNGGALGMYDSGLVLVNSVVRGNEATGMDDSPGQAGSGGGVIVDGAGRGVRVCGAVVRDNQANTYGGGVLVFARDRQGSVEIDRTTISGNQIPNHSTMPSKAGGLFLEGMPVTITATTISGNQSRSDGGMFLGPGVALTMTNTTIAENTALSSLAGGISMAPGVTGTIRNCTLARNRAPGPLAFAGAIVGGRDVLLANTVIWGSEVGDGYAPISCMDALLEGGGNLQWPIERAGGTSDIPEAPCSPQILAADALLGALADHGGPTLTILPAPDSPALGLGRDCPPVDQRGVPRRDPCTSGAVEAPAALRPAPPRPPAWPWPEPPTGRPPHAP